MDESVRKVWQIAPEKISLEGKGWASKFEELVVRVAEGLGLPPKEVKADFLMRSVNCVTISVAFRQGFSVSTTRFPLTLRRRTVLIHTLAQSLDHLRTQVECNLRQTQKNILKINQACRCGIR